MSNMILNTDSYKHSHFLQYPPRTQRVFSYIESRGGPYSHSLFFGLQAFIKEYLSKPITQADIDEAEEIVKAHGLPFNREGWQYILDNHKGFMPVIIRAVPEGTLVPTGNVLLTVCNTDVNCHWLTSFLETALLRAVWYPTTVATISFNIKRIIKKYLEETGDVNLLPFKLHDFGSRGVSSAESAGLGGLAHLVNFMGTDTMEALLYARRYYGEPMAGFSIPAAEHSTMTSWGQEHEADAYMNMVKKFGGKDKLYAVVSDSYNIYEAVDKIWGGVLKDDLLMRGGCVVIRPDSGNPPEVVLKVAELLAKKFGFTINTQGFKVLHPSVRIIQGDGINEVTIIEILEKLKENGFSADNIAFGMGGALLQHMNRDTMKFAMKCSAVMVDYHWRDVFKDPITDAGKRSKRGCLDLVKVDGEFKTINTLDYLNTSEKAPDSELHLVYATGDRRRDETLAKVRERANSYL